MSNEYINVIGAGLAGCEAAWQIAKNNIKVRLYEMKPEKKSPAHHLNSYAELVCSNSLRSDQLENAVGLLKQELRALGSLIIECADETRVPAGGALAVDRVGFSELVTEKIKFNPNIEIISKEINSLNLEEMNIIATGPLTSDSFSQYIGKLLGNEYLYFFDAAAPIVKFESINMEKAFKAARYGRGTDDYINCPMNKDEYIKFYTELINAQTVELQDFEDKSVFEGCMPVEVMAKRGIDTLRFGPLKPVGLKDRDGQEPYAVVQLRQDDKEGTLFNIVGFQTHLKWGEQKRVFSLIPGLENAEFIRYGVMHRNTFINSPGVIDEAYNLKSNNNIFFAGQITGVEGYIESTASGYCAGINAVRSLKEKEKIIFTSKTAIGALANYISNYASSNFQPMNINFGIMERPTQKIRDKKQKNLMIAQNSLSIIDETKNKYNI